MHAAQRLPEDCQTENKIMAQKRMFMKMLGGSMLYVGAGANGALSAPQTGVRGISTFPNHILHTHDGRKMRFYDDVVKGKVIVFNMMYTVCTGICPINTASLLQVQQALGDRVGRDIFIFSLTLRPEMDTPGALRDYATRYGVTKGWTFLTGVPAEVDEIRRAMGFYDTDPVADADITNHTGILRIGNAGRDRWLMTPTVIPTSQIVRSILNVI
jgi:protein SCO1/2